MGNQIDNCGFVDGVAGWTAGGGAVRAVDETVRGGPGRAVMTLTRVATGAGEVTTLVSTQVAVAAGAKVEGMALIGALGATVAASIAIRDGGGVLLERIPLAVQRAYDGAVVRGIRETLTQVWTCAPASATGQAALELVATSLAAGATEAWLAKPYLDPAWAPRPHPVWDPGLHDNVDLQLPCWPASLPPVSEQGYAPTPTVLRKGFEGDLGIEATRRTGMSPWTKLKAAVNCDPVQRDTLETFHQGGETPFWFVKPDTDQLCRARWLSDGDPTLQSQAPGRAMMGFGLLLQVA